MSEKPSDACRTLDEHAGGGALNEAGVVLRSTLTCPHCGSAKEEAMPTDACQWFYECEGCRALLRPRPGDCCVFCSYGTQKCPPVQLRGGSACCSA